MRQRGTNAASVRDTSRRITDGSKNGMWADLRVMKPEFGELNPTQFTRKRVTARIIAMNATERRVRLAICERRLDAGLHGDAFFFLGGKG
jgi:hypothetical protein